MEVLVVNFLLYFIYFFFTRRNSGMLFKALIIMFMFVSISSIFIWESGIYGFIHFRFIHNWELNYAPFLYLFGVFIFLFEPIRKFNEKKIETIELDDTFKIEAIGTFAIAFGILFFFLLVMFVDIGASLESASEAYKDHEDGELVMPQFLYTLNTLHKLLYHFTLLLAFYYLAFKPKAWLKTALLFTSAFLPKFFIAIVLVSRGGLFFMVIEVLICYFIFKKFFTKKIKRFIYFGGIGAMALMIPVVVIFTTSRFEQARYTPLMSVFKYFGESFLNFNCTFWGNVDKHPMNEFKFPFLYSLYETPESFISRREKYNYFSSMTGTNTLLFKTLVGDFYLEYGAPLAAIILIVISRLYGRLIRINRTIKFSTLFLLFYYAELMFIGVFDLVWHGKFLLQMIGFITLLYIFIKFKFKTDTVLE